MPTPLAHLDTAAIHLYSKIDSLWYRAPFEFHQRDSMLRQYVLTADWHLGTEYSLEVDSAAFTDIYGLVSKEYKQGLRVKPLDEFATILLQMSGLQEEKVVVQLLTQSEEVVQSTAMEADGTAQFYYVDPATYYVRAFTDRNGNGVWDTGDYDADRQAEDVYYYPREIVTKANWDMTQSWNVTERKRNEQKPGKLVKQKNTQNKRKLRNRNAERAKQLGIDYVKK